MEELIAALQDRYGQSLLVHWEDLSSKNSYRLLARARDKVPCPQVPIRTFWFTPDHVCMLKREAIPLRWLDIDSGSTQYRSYLLIKVLQFKLLANGDQQHSTISGPLQQCCG